jgi:ubiquinone/menaquinone biosynthesis C-methylase UbiE
MPEYSAKTRYMDERIARNYDRTRFSTPQGRLTDDIERQAVHRLAAAFAEGSVILDLASGLGRFARLALEAGHSVVAADISAEMLADAGRRLGKNDGFKGAVLCEAESLPFEDNAFDAVIAIRFIGMLPRTARRDALKEMRRVTHRWVLLNLPNSASAISPLLVLRKLTGRRPEYYPASPWAWRRELTDVGLQIVAWRGPLVVPTRRLPKILLGVAKLANWIGERSYLRYLSEQYFVLLEKTVPP